MAVLPQVSTGQVIMRYSGTHGALDDVRVLKSALKASKLCIGLLILVLSIDARPTHFIEQHRLDLAEIVIERAAFYNDRLLSQDGGDSKEYQCLRAHLVTDYTNIRVIVVGIRSVHASFYTTDGILGMAS